MARIKRVFPADDDPIFDGEFVVGFPVRENKPKGDSEPPAPEGEPTSPKPQRASKKRLATQQDLD